MTTVDPMALMDDAPIELKVTESRAARRARLSTGGLLVGLGVLLAILSFRARGDAAFALSDAFAAVPLPTIVVPGMATALVCGLITAVVGAGFLSGRLTGSLRTWSAVVAGFAVAFGFVAWAGSGSAFPFPVANQLSGTIVLATPLVFGALAGVLCENAGVVNVSIEGEFLVAAFTAATVGSITGSLVAAMLAAMAAGVAMAALLALFSIKYLVDQVVLGVVLNLLASGVTGFLFDQLVQPNSATLNAAPQLSRVAIPGLSAIPLLGPALFNQSPLVYIALIAVIVVAFLLYRTRWGLRVRSVGEHPEAADTVGINVRRTRWMAVLVGGMFAGLGGAYFTIGSTGGFIKDITVGNGFIALAAVIMGRWHPVYGALTALFFGFARALAQTTKPMQLPIPSHFIEMLPYLATIVAVAGLVGRVRPPAADGAHFVKSH